MAAHDPQSRGVAPQQLRCAPRHPGVRKTVEAVAAQAPALAPLRRQRVGRRRRRAASRERRCQSTRPPGSVREQPRVTASSAASDLGWCKGARSIELAQVRLDGRRRSSPRRGSARRRARCDGRPRPPRPAASRARARSRRASTSARGAVRARRASIVLSSPVEQRQLEAARAGVDDQDAQDRAYPGVAARGSGRCPPPGQRQSVTSGGSSPCSRV